VTWFGDHLLWLLSGLWHYGVPFAIVLGVVVLFHEFGHFLVAKLCGVTVEVFSVGFGPRIAGFRRRGTDYRLSWVPLGGYVKLKGEMPEENGPPPEPGDLLARPRWQRFLVFVMGAAFNLMTALGLTTALYKVGMKVPAYESRPPVIGDLDPNSPAAAAGFEPGDLILSFAGKPVPTWRDLQFKVLLDPGPAREIVVRRGGRTITTRIAIERDASGIGVPIFSPETGVEVGGLQSDRPAARAGLRIGDRIAAIDGAPIATAGRIIRAIQESAGRPLRVTIERDGRTFDVSITPFLDGDAYRIGFNPVPIQIVRSYPFVEAVRESLLWNVEQTGLIFISFKKLLTRQLSLRAFSGPIDIYRVSGVAAQEGLVPFLQWIALVSLQLGIINLLPIPPLDGGHLFTLVIEGTLRRELSMRLKERIMQVGLALLLLFMGTVIFYDILKNIPHAGR
jgi:regulator of sigma E protease